ncbi:c-type cytochrome [Thioclava atlantica]|uniref:Cytochrome c, class II n=1 Tax=Thioclava atlantica TaxID=1317124 RepID=A0A085U0U6_9RHOB|nr:cytochrome c [Thioclava atlantica]KFE36593.1 cytochrome c, class II [Thioclava atlantica]
MRKTLLALTFVLPAAAAFAQSPEDTVKARQGYFDLLGAQMAVLAPMAQGKMDFDAAKAETAAKNLGALAKVDITPLFPEGTSNADLMDTRALPVIWERGDDFKAKLSAMHAAASEMEAAAGSLETLGPAVGKLGGACKACHDDFRAK